MLLKFHVTDYCIKLVNHCLLESKENIAENTSKGRRTYFPQIQKGQADKQ